jgi:DNA-binding protein YbaB
MLDKMKQVMEMQKKAKEVQKTLENLRVEKVSPGGKIRLVMNGNHQVESLSLDESVLNPAQKSAVEKALAELISEANDEVRRESASRAMSLMKDMNLNMPGL